MADGGEYRAWLLYWCGCDVMVPAGRCGVYEGGMWLGALYGGGLLARVTFGGSTTETATRANVTLGGVEGKVNTFQCERSPIII